MNYRPEVLDVEFASGQEPTEPDDFVTLVLVTFRLSGQDLARLLGCQRRVLSRRLERLPERTAIAIALDSNELAQAVFPAVRRFVVNYVLDEFYEEDLRAPRLEGVWSAESDLPYRAKIGDESIVFELEMDVLSR